VCQSVAPKNPVATANWDPDPTRGACWVGRLPCENGNEGGIIHQVFQGIMTITENIFASS
jgi:hypothetical protein